VLYAVTMLVASNYLDHHWLWDGIAGISLAVVAVWLSGLALGHRKQPEARVPSSAEAT
jgi:membrane-associated phospholipid phosphatase